MKVRELREILSEFDQESEVRINMVFDEGEVSFTGLNVFDIIDIDTNVNDEIILEVG